MSQGLLATRREGDVAPPAAPPRAGSKLAPVAIVVLIVACAAQALAWVVAGQANGDEGWYLYDATRAVHGAIPYRDFAFTQTPLTLYVYGLPQLVVHGLFTGRVVSAILAVAGIGLCAWVVQRRAGAWAAAAFLVMVLAFPIGFYNLVLVKTYALALVLMAGCLAALTSSRPDRIRYPAATAIACALVLTRTTGIFVLVPIVVLALVVGDRITRRRVVGVGAAGALIGLVFVAVDPVAAKFDLAEFHQVLWFGTPLNEKISTIVRLRLPDWLTTYWPFVILGVVTVAVMVGTRRGRALCRAEPGWPVMLVGLTGFLLSQMTAGQFAGVEYFAPAAPILVAVAVVVIARAGIPRSWSPPLVGAVTVGAVVVAAVLSLGMPNATDAGWQAYVAGTDGPRSVAWLNSVADEVQAVTAPGDEVLVLHLQAVLVAADRAAPTGISMGVFSFTDMSTDDAQRLGWVNRDMIVGMLDAGQPEAVVFDAVDWAVLEHGGTLSLKPGDARPVREALERNYQLTPTTVPGAEVWLRR